MQTTPAPRARAHALCDLQAFLEASRHMRAATSPDADETGPDVEIDIDREIWCLEQLSGVADVVGHGARQTRDYIAWIASICADAGDQGLCDSRIRRVVAAATRHDAPAWRRLADLLAQRCAVFMQRYGIESVDGPSGEVIRWLFAEAEAHPAAVWH